MSVVLLSSDLAVLSRVEGAAARAGKSVRIASTVAQVSEFCNDDRCDTVLVDLSLASLDIAALVAQLKSTSASTARTIAFGPHVHEERLAAARSAGCDQVVSRGHFFSHLDTVLAD